jgi:5'-methylthioadenosine phosphorylase
MTRPRIGILGGSGLYQIDGLTDVEWRRIESPFGAGVDVVFLPRHGRGHRIRRPTSITAPISTR